MVATLGAVKDWKFIVGGLPVRRKRFSVAGGVPNCYAAPRDIMRRQSVGMLLATILSIVGPSMVAQTSSADSTMAVLIEKWDKRDGAAVIEVGSELSDQFVLDGAAFFRAMKLHPESFRSLIDELPSSTFTVYEYKYLADSVRLQVKFLKLRDHMLARARKFRRHPEFSQMLDMLTSALKKMQIEFVD